MVTFNRKQPALNLKYYEFLNRESLVDATIIADGHVIQAHKVILAAASSYFEVKFFVFLFFCTRFSAHNFRKISDFFLTLHGINGFMMDLCEMIEFFRVSCYKVNLM